MRKPDRQYLTRFTAGMVLYSILLPVSIVVMRQLEAPAKYIVALLPLIGFAIVVWSVITYLRDADEFQARKVLEALAISIVPVLAVGFTWGLIQFAGGPVLNPFWLVPVWAVGFGIGSVVTGKKYLQ